MGVRMTRDEFVEALASDKGNCWWVADRADEMRALFSPDDDVVGYLVMPELDEKSGDRERWTFWVLTRDGLVYYLTDLKTGATQTHRIKTSNIVGAGVEIGDMPPKQPWDDEQKRYVKAARASIPHNYTPLSGVTELAGQDFLSAWGGHPSDTALRAAVQFFQNFSTVAS